MLNPEAPSPPVLPEWFHNAFKIWGIRSEGAEPRHTHGLEALAVVRRCLLAEPKVNLKLRIEELERELAATQRDLASEKERNNRPFNPLTYIEQIAKLKKTADEARISEQSRMRNWLLLVNDTTRHAPGRIEHIRIEIEKRLERIRQQLIKFPLHANRPNSQDPQLLQSNEPAVRPALAD